MALTPDGQYLYVPVFNTSGKGVLVVIDTTTNTVSLPATAAQLGDDPTAVAISPNDRDAYVTDGVDGTVTVIAISPD